MKIKHIASLLIAALTCTALSFTFLYAQEVVTSASGAGYGGSGAFNTNAAWLTTGTAIRVYPAPFTDETTEKNLADLSKRYRYLPFAFYLFPDHMLPYASVPVHYNMHYDSLSGNIAYSTLPAFNMEDSSLAAAFHALYDAGNRIYEENLFVKRMLEMQVGGKDFKIDWSATTEPRLVKEFFFSETVPLTGQWQTWFGNDWAEANLTLLQDYCAAATFAAMLLPSFNGGPGGGTWEDTSGAPMQYDLPSSRYAVPAATATYHELYNEMLGMFTSSTGEITWALIWEPVADFYPQGKPELRAWSSSSDIAQVLAEKAFAEYDFYKFAANTIAADKPLLEPFQGSYTRYFAQLFYQMRFTNAFDDFLFRETRAIFTNNYSGQYIADQFLLADALRPEVNNDKGYLGGWAIVYLRDLLKQEPSVEAMRYGLLIDQQNLAVSGTSYGNLAAFSSSPPTQTVSWYQHPAGADDLPQEAQLDLVSAANTPVVGSVIGLSDLSSYCGLYTATQEVFLENAWLTSQFARTDVSPEPSLLDRSLLAVVAQPVTGNVIGTARYETPEGSLRSYFDAAGLMVLENLQSVSKANVATLGRSDNEVESSMQLKALSGMANNQSGTDFAASYLASISHLSTEVVKNATGQTLNANDDNQPLLSISGTIPITYALRLPQTEVRARIVTLKIGDPAVLEEELDFDVADLLEYSPEECPAVVLGWNSDVAAVDVAAIRAAASSLPAVPTSVDASALQLASGADKAFVLNCGDAVQAAASDDGSGVYTGVTIVIVLPEADTIDLIMYPLDIRPNVSGTQAEVIMTVANTTTNIIPTRITLRVTTTGFSLQTYTIPVTLSPDLSAASQIVNLPAGGGDVYFFAEVNPEPRDTNEIDYANNITADVFTIPSPPEIDPLDPQCVTSFTWVERRHHTWSIYYPPPPKSSGCGYTAYYYCVHEYRYRMGITASLSYSYRHEGIEYAGEASIPCMKSGYGFAPRVDLDYSGVELLSSRRLAGSNCFDNPDASLPPSSTSQAIIELPTIANVSWYGGWRGMGHSLSDYVIYNPEKGTNQYYNGIAMAHSGVAGDHAAGTFSFTPAPNPLSNTTQERIYTNVALKDGQHDFRIDISGGSISYKVNWPSYYSRAKASEWGGCPTSEAVEVSQMDPTVYTYLDFDQCLGLSLDGEVNILGNMYEDDHTGATIP